MSLGGHFFMISLVAAVMFAFAYNDDPKEVGAHKLGYLLTAYCLGSVFYAIGLICEHGLFGASDIEKRLETAERKLKEMQDEIGREQKTVLLS